MIAIEIVEVKLYSAHLSSAKSHRAEKHLLADPLRHFTNEQVTVGCSRMGVPDQMTKP